MQISEQSKRPAHLLWMASLNTKNKHSSPWMRNENIVKTIQNQRRADL